MIEYLFPLFLTIFLECVIILIIFQTEPKSTFLYIALINLFTHPIATLLYSNVSLNFYIVEILVFLVEAFLIKLLFNLRYFRAFLLSFVANLTTAAISLWYIFM
ncbi:hypothetical protein ACFLZN_01340 [Nanoarchaeota archaeon]